jgi:flagellar hook-associated protein 1
MSLSSIMNAAVSGLQVAQAGLAETANNIANVNTAGHARTRIMPASAVTAGLISGVVAGDPVRIADRFLEETVHRRSGQVGETGVLADYLDRIQSLLAPPGAKGGLPNRLDQIEAAAIALSAPGTAWETAAQFLDVIQDAIGTIQQLDGDITRMRSDVETEVGATVESVNGLLRQIHTLNDQIQGNPTPGALDQRNRAIETLGKLVQIVPRPQANGRINIDTASGAALLDTRLRQISYPASGNGLQASYPAMSLRYADANGQPGAATGESIGSSAVGGKLGGLLDVRDRLLPALSEQLGGLMQGLAESLNRASNAASAVPAPQMLDGRITGLVASDRIGFTGQAEFAVISSTGKLVARATLDFDALGPSATVADAVAAINAGLGGAATALFQNNRLTITAAGADNGVAVADGASNPARRAGVGFSQFFGLNDIVRSPSSPLVPSGFAADDPHGFAQGSTFSLVLRDAGGRQIARHDVVMQSGGTMADILADLNASPLAANGQFTIDDRGRFRFDAATAFTGASLTIAGDSSDRLGTGLGFGTLSGLSSRAVPLGAVAVRGDIIASPTRLPIAVLQPGTAIGQTVLGGADRRGASQYIDSINAAVDLGKAGVATIAEFGSRLVTATSRESAQAAAASDNANARLDDAVNRRNSFSGVNIDEELAGMVTLQNSYAASARVLSAARDMYDTLLNMVR